jgi:hypothetical protein
MQISQEHLRSNLNAESEVIKTSIAQEIDTHINEAKKSIEEITQIGTETLHRNLNRQKKNFDKAVVWFTLICILTICLVVTGRIIMEKRIGQVEQNAISHLSETTVGSDDIAKSLQAFNKVEEGIVELDKKLKIELKRPLLRPLPSPLEQMQTIIASANRFHGIRVKPTLSSKTWELGLATIKGHVRTENQDYGLCFKIRGHDVLIVADGCGGVPHGRRAAYLAVKSAAVSIVHDYGTAPLWYSPHVKDISAKAILRVSHRLAIEGDKLNITDIRLGPRTTLIVVIGNKRESGYAYIGDGGGCVVKANGEVNRFLDPQKADNFAMNVLAASLGPVSQRHHEAIGNMIPHNVYYG